MKKNKKIFPNRLIVGACIVVCVGSIAAITAGMRAKQGKLVSNMYIQKPARQQHVPSYFPRSFPIYPEASLSGTLDGTNENNEGNIWLSFITPHSYEKVVAFYEKELPGTQWHITDTIALADGRTMLMKHPEWTGTFVISPGETEGTRIIIVLQKITASFLPGTAKP